MSKLNVILQIDEQSQVKLGRYTGSVRLWWMNEHVEVTITFHTNASQDI